MENYKFNPLNYGFEPVSKFPELRPFCNEDDFIKIVSLSDFPEEGREVYFFMACNPDVSGDFTDARIKFFAGVYDEARPNPEELSHYPRLEYYGLVSNDAFAKELLCHLMANTKNESVVKEGIERLNSDLTQKIAEENLKQT